MTAKQDLVAHLDSQHGLAVHRGTHKQLALRHKLDHEARHLLHSHKPVGWVTGGDAVDVKITLCPPKNPGASRNGDRNWVLHIAHLSEGRGFRLELPGTWIGDPDEAKKVAVGVLGYQPEWKEKGWGWEVVGG